MKKYYPVSRPKINLQDYARVFKALRKAELSGFSSQYIPDFEELIAESSGKRFATTVNSGTSGILLALRVLNISKGDLIAVSTFTNMATIFPIIQLGGIPVPVDANLDDMNLNIDDLKKVMKLPIKGIVVAHIYGQVADMFKIRELVQGRQIWILEDCAEAHGATLNGHKAGSFGDLSVFSFFANKIVGTGEGGAVATDSFKMFQKMSSLKSLAFGKKNKFIHEDHGYNYRMTNLQAALGVGQIQRLFETLEYKKEQFEFYNHLLKNHDNVIIPTVNQNSTSAYWVYAIRLKNKSEKYRDQILQRLHKNGVEARPGFMPISRQVNISKNLKYINRATPNANMLSRDTLYIPTGFHINRRDQIEIIDRLNESLI